MLELVRRGRARVQHVSSNNRLSHTEESETLSRSVRDLRGSAAG